MEGIPSELLLGAGGAGAAATALGAGLERADLILKIKAMPPYAERMAMATESQRRMAHASVSQNGFKGIWNFSVWYIHW